MYPNQNVHTLNHTSFAENVLSTSNTNTHFSTKHVCLDHPHTITINLKANVFFGYFIFIIIIILMGIILLLLF